MRKRLGRRTMIPARDGFRRWSRARSKASKQRSGVLAVAIVSYVVGLLAFRRRFAKRYVRERVRNVVMRVQGV